MSSGCGPCARFCVITVVLIMLLVLWRHTCTLVYTRQTATFRRRLLPPSSGWSKKDDRSGKEGEVFWPNKDEETIEGVYACAVGSFINCVFDWHCASPVGKTEGELNGRDRGQAWQRVDWYKMWVWKYWGNWLFWRRQRIWNNINIYLICMFVYTHTHTHTHIHCKQGWAFLNQPSIYEISVNHAVSSKKIT